MAQRISINDLVSTSKQSTLYVSSLIWTISLYSPGHNWEGKRFFSHLTDGTLRVTFSPKVRFGAQSAVGSQHPQL